MDVDFRASRVNSVKHVSAIQASRLNFDNYIILDDSEGDEEINTFFPCPFCYVDIEVDSLCSHLQNEHCFDLKNAVCPICAANFGMDATGHFITQHTNSLKRRKRSQKSGVWNNSSPLCKELSLFLGSSAGGNTHEIASDPLVSPFPFSTPFQETAREQSEDTPCRDSSAASDSKSNAMTSSHKNHKQDEETIRQRASFVQQLITSAIL